MIFVVMVGCGITYFHPDVNSFPKNSAKIEQQTIVLPVPIISNLDQGKNGSQSAVVPIESPPKTPFFENAPSSTSSSSSSATTNTGDSGRIGSGVASPSSDLSIYAGDPAKGSTQHLQSIDWSIGGPITPGQSRVSSTVYLRNEAATSLNVVLSTANWAFKTLAGTNLSSDYGKYFTLTWDYDNSTIAVNQVVPVVFTLVVASNIVDVATFSFDIIVTTY